MNRGEAYRALSIELESQRQRPYAELRALAGAPAESKILRLGAEDVTISVAVEWARQSTGVLRIRATAFSEHHLTAGLSG